MAKRVLGDDPFAASRPAAPVKSSAKPARGARPKAQKTSVSTPRRSPRADAPAVMPPDAVSVHPPSESSAPVLYDDLGAADVPPDLAVPSLTVPVPDLPAETHAATEEPRAIDIESAIRDLEAGIDRLLHAARPGESPEQTSQATMDRVSDRLHAAVGGRTAALRESDTSGLQDAARELLSSEYYLRQWGRVAMRDRTESVDEFGLDPVYQSRWQPVLDFLYDRWWRVEVEGIENVPTTGPVALVANHAGALPYDGLMLSMALRREHPAARTLRWLAEDFVFHFPFVGVHVNRLGAVRACQENAERLLRRGACVGLFPEGVKGVAKPYRERYHLQRFGRGGHIKLALRTRTPIVPVTILGAEETHPMVLPGGFLAKVLGVPYVPVTPTFPWLGPLGLVPLPSKWRIFVGEPLAMDGYGPDAADDEVLVGRLNEKLRATIQHTLDNALRTRGSSVRGENAKP